MLKDKIVFYRGKRGSGKTLTMVKDAYNYYIQGIKIYSNISVSFEHEKINKQFLINLMKDDSINNCVIIIDEIQIYFDSRRSASSKNVSFSKVVQQLRKRGIILLCTTQYTGTVELRIRQHIDIMVNCKHNDEFNICENEYIDLTRIEDGLVNTSVNTIIFDASSVYNMYNTKEIIS